MKYILVPIVSRTEEGQSTNVNSLARSLTQVQMKTRVQSHPASESYQVLCGSEGAEVLVTLPDSVTLTATAIVSVGH
jgi:hypothetical protein